MAEFHPRALQWQRPRVGALPDSADARFYAVLNRYPDEVFIEDKIVYIVEAKMTAEVGALAQLKLYNKLFPDTPRFSDVADYVRKMVMVTPQKDRVLEEMAAEDGIEVVIYRPTWYAAWLARKLNIPIEQVKLT
jgi:hypothetical protein